MDALDGNAIAGPLADIFARDMTAVTGTCAHCRTSAQVAELRVFSKAPGTIARCRNCGTVVLVLIETQGADRIMLDRFGLINRAAAQSPLVESMIQPPGRPSMSE